VSPLEREVDPDLLQDREVVGRSVEATVSSLRMRMGRRASVPIHRRIRPVRTQ